MKKSQRNRLLDICIPAAIAIVTVGIIAGVYLRSVAYAARTSPVLLVETDIGHGSGVSLGRGMVLTAAHVIKDAKEIKVSGPNGDATPAKVVWSAADYDIALLETDARYDGAPLSCAAVVPGQAIRAVGNPGDLKFLETRGVVAADIGHLMDWQHVVALDATIVPGMSGGPVFNRSGEIVGIVVAVQSVMLGWGHVAMTRFGLMVPSSSICRLLGRA